MYDDDVYLKQLQSQEWFNYSGFIDQELVRADIPSFKYLVFKFNELEQYCTDKVFEHVMSKPNLFESQNARALERNGVPPKYMRKFLLKLYNIKEGNQVKYETQFELTFKGHDVKNLGNFVPYFTGKNTLEESLPYIFLNEKGKLALKEILWMLNSEVTNIEFSPLIIKICSIILLFCNKYETFEIMTNILETNYDIKDTSKIRWQIRFTYNDNVRIVSSILEAVSEISFKSGRESFEHFTQIHFPPEKLYEDMCYSFFLNYFNFYGIIRLLPFFLTEGIKSIYRLSYAVIKTLKNDILNITSPDEVIMTIRRKAKIIDDITKLFNLSYTFGLTRWNNKYDFQEMPHKDEFRDKRNQYYLPKFNGVSEILTDYEAIHLWERLPIDLKIKDAMMIYNASKDGYNLQTVIGLNEKYENTSTILFLIETPEDEVFGGIISNLINHTNGKYTSPSTSLLVQIRPKLQVFSAAGDSDVLYVDSTCFMFGGGSKGPAIRLDKDLNKGFSYDGGCFKNPVLVKDENGEFCVKKFEIFSLS